MLVAHGRNRRQIRSNKYCRPLQNTVTRYEFEIIPDLMVPDATAVAGRSSSVCRPARTCDQCTAPHRSLMRLSTFAGINKFNACGSTSIRTGSVPSSSPSASTNSCSADPSRLRHSTETHFTSSIVCA